MVKCTEALALVCFLSYIHLFIHSFFLSFFITPCFFFRITVWSKWICIFSPNGKIYIYLKPLPHLHLSVISLPRPLDTHSLSHTHFTHTKHTVTPRTKIGSQERFGAMNWLYSGGFSPSSPFSLYLFLSFTLSNHLWAATLQSSYNCLVQSLSLAITAGYESSQSNTDTTAIYICVSVCVWVIRQEGRRSVYI